MGYAEYGGHIEQPLRGTDSVAIVRNREYLYFMDVTKEGLHRQLAALDRFHKVERVYIGLDFPSVLPKLEQAIMDANSKKSLHGRVDFTRRLTKLNH